jgi:hypothetical protein
MFTFKFKNPYYLPKKPLALAAYEPAKSCRKSTTPGRNPKFRCLRPGCVVAFFMFWEASSPINKRVLMKGTLSLDCSISFVRLLSRALRDQHSWADAMAVGAAGLISIDLSLPTVSAILGTPQGFPNLLSLLLQQRKEEAPK